MIIFIYLHADMAEKNDRKGVPRKGRCHTSRKHLRHRCPVKGCNANVINLRKIHYKSCHSVGPNYVPMGEWEKLYGIHMKERRQTLRHTMQSRREGQSMQGAIAHNDQMVQQQQEGAPQNVGSLSQTDMETNTSTAMERSCSQSGHEGTQAQMNIDTLTDEFYEWMRKPIGGGLASSTAKKHQRSINEIAEAIGAKTICTDRVRQMLDRLHEDLSDIFDPGQKTPGTQLAALTALSKFIDFCELKDITVASASKVKVTVSSLKRYYSREQKQRLFDPENVLKRLEQSVPLDVVTDTMNYVKALDMPSEADKFSDISIPRKELTKLYCYLRNIMMFRIIVSNGRRGTEVLNFTLDEFETRLSRDDLKICFVSTILWWHSVFAFCYLGKCC